jgi:hypothetical protein
MQIILFYFILATKLVFSLPPMINKSDLKIIDDEGEGRGSTRALLFYFPGFFTQPCRTQDVFGNCGRRNVTFSNPAFNRKSFLKEVRRKMKIKQRQSLMNRPTKTDAVSRSFMRISTELKNMFSLYEQNSRKHVILNRKAKLVLRILVPMSIGKFKLETIYRT